ncbi:hypothetical protein AMTRI_Chr10g227900 [Amborella trichopoda]
METGLLSRVQGLTWLAPPTSFNLPSRRLLPPRSLRTSCYKMFVPGFGEVSPEAKAAGSLHNFFNFLAVKIVLAQLQSYNPEAYEELMDFISRNSLNDGDKFCSNLMRESPRHRTLGMSLNFEIIIVYTLFIGHYHSQIIDVTILKRKNLFHKAFVQLLSKSLCNFAMALV